MNLIIRMFWYFLPNFMNSIVDFIEKLLVEIDKIEKEPGIDNLQKKERVSLFLKGGCPFIPDEVNSIIVEIVVTIYKSGFSAELLDSIQGIVNDFLASMATITETTKAAIAKRVLEEHGDIPERVVRVAIDFILLRLGK